MVDHADSQGPASADPALKPIRYLDNSYYQGTYKWLTKRSPTRQTRHIAWPDKHLAMTSQAR